LGKGRLSFRSPRGGTKWCSEEVGQKTSLLSLPRCKGRNGQLQSIDVKKENRRKPIGRQRWTPVMPRGFSSFSIGQEKRGEKKRAEIRFSKEEKKKNPGERKRRRILYYRRHLGWKALGGEKKKTKGGFSISAEKGALVLNEVLGGIDGEEELFSHPLYPRRTARAIIDGEDLTKGGGHAKLEGVLGFPANASVGKENRGGGSGRE